MSPTQSGLALDGVPGSGQEAGSHKTAGSLSPAVLHVRKSAFQHSRIACAASDKLQLPATRVARGIGSTREDRARIHQPVREVAHHPLGVNHAVGHLADIVGQQQDCCRRGIHTVYRDLLAAIDQLAGDTGHAVDHPLEECMRGHREQHHETGREGETGESGRDGPRSVQVEALYI